HFRRETGTPSAPSIESRELAEQEIGASHTGVPGTVIAQYNRAAGPVSCRVLRGGPTLHDVPGFRWPACTGGERRTGGAMTDIEHALDSGGAYDRDDPFPLFA